jgi:hypothetical protein
VNDRYSAIAVAPDNDIITVARVVMPPIPIMVSYADAHARRANADIRFLSMHGKHDCNPDGRK